MSVKKYFSVGLILLLFWACENRPASVTSSLPYYNTPDFTPVFIHDTSERSHTVHHTIDSFTCLDQHGDVISLYDIAGKIHVANFIFTSCASICPKLTKNFKLLQDRFYEDTAVVMLSFSVTPWIDSVPRLKEYAVRNDIHAHNWHLLTGSKGEIYNLARTSYFAEENIGFTKDSTEFLHTEHILLIDKTLRIRGIYNGTLELETMQLMEDIETLKKENSGD